MTVLQELYNGYGWRLTLEEAPLPDGRVRKGVRVHRSDSVHILAFKTPSTILLLREFRPFYGDWIYMLPSGKVDKETDIDVAARRELREETGYDARTFKRFGSVNTSETIAITNYLYLAEDLFFDPLPKDSDELMEVEECTIDAAIDKVLSSSHIHGSSVCALLRYSRGERGE